MLIRAKKALLRVFFFSNTLWRVAANCKCGERATKGGYSVVYSTREKIHRRGLAVVLKWGRNG